MQSVSNYLIRPDIQFQYFRHDCLWAHPEQAVAADVQLLVTYKVLAHQAFVLIAVKSPLYEVKTPSMVILQGAKQRKTSELQAPLQCDVVFPATVL